MSKELEKERFIDKFMEAFKKLGEKQRHNQKEAEKEIPFYRTLVKPGRQFFYGVGKPYHCTILTVGKKQIKYKEVYMHDNSSKNRVVDWKTFAWWMYDGMHVFDADNE